MQYYELLESTILSIKPKQSLYVRILDSCKDSLSLIIYTTIIMKYQYFVYISVVYLNLFQLQTRIK